MRVGSTSEQRWKWKAFGVLLASLVVGLPLARFGLHWLLLHGNSYSVSDLRTAKRYVESLPDAVAPYMFSGNDALIGIAGTRDHVMALKHFLIESRAGYYRANLLGDGQIEIVISPGVLSASPERRAEAIEGLGLAPSTRAVILSAEAAPSGCATLSRVQFGWIERGYVLVDSDTVESPFACGAVGFDILSGFPVRDASYDYRTLPSGDVRRLVMDFVSACSQWHKSDVDPELKNGWGVSRPSLACVSREIQEALNIKGQAEDS